MKLSFVEIAGFRGFRTKERFDLAEGFNVLSGHNGTGKSTMLDAIEFAIAGTISKYSVKEARGGGLVDHIWWVGNADASEHYVTIGFASDNGEHFTLTRDRARGCDMEPAQIVNHLCSRATIDQKSILETLMKTTLIRDELISALSLDLPEQARFTTVRAAIGELVGPDYSKRTAAILSAANVAISRQEGRIKETNDQLGRALSALTEARSLAEQASDISEALQIIESFGRSLPNDLTERTESVRRLITEALE